MCGPVVVWCVRKDGLHVYCGGILVATIAPAQWLHLIRALAGQLASDGAGQEFSK